MKAPIERLTLGRKIGYSFGDMGSQFIYSTIAIYLMYYFTDVAGLSALHAGLILFITRFWDALIDPFIGYLGDHTQSRWGQKRPYILFGALPMGAAFFFLLSPPDLSYWGRFAYFFTMTMAVWSLYSLVNVPYNSMLANLTYDSKERSEIAGIKMILVIIGIIVIGAATLPLVKSAETEAAGFSRVGLVYGVVAALLFWIAFLSVRERVTPANERYRLSDMLRLVKQNRPFLILAAAACLSFLAQTVTSSVINYFFKYNIKDEGFIPIAFTCIFVTSAAAIPLWVIISKKTGKKAVYMASMAVYGIIFLLTYLIHEINVFTYIVFIVAGIGFAGMNLSIWSMIPDTVEFSQCHLGARCEGVLYGVYIFILKTAAALAGIVVGQGLDLFGYAANVEQGEGSLLGIRILMSIVPFVIYCIAIIVISFYPITEKMHADMLDKIGEARS